MPHGADSTKFGHLESLSVVSMCVNLGGPSVLFQKELFLERLRNRERDHYPIFSFNLGFVKSF